MELTRASRLQRRLLTGLLSVVVLLQSAQLVLKALGLGTWPFCSYDMFAFRIRPPMRSASVVLLDDSGGTVRVRPGSTLPIEFFRATALLNSVFVSGGDEREKASLAEDMLTRLRMRPWQGFDETWAAVRPPAGRQFVGLAVDVIDEKLNVDHGAARLTITGFERVYQSPVFRKLGQEATLESARN